MAPSQATKGILKEDGADAATMERRQYVREAMAASRARAAGDPNALEKRKAGRKPLKK